MVFFENELINAEDLNELKDFEAVRGNFIGSRNRLTSAQADARTNEIDTNENLKVIYLLSWFTLASISSEVWMDLELIS